MAGARFSIFRVAGRHEAAGLWLEDMLAGDRRLWLVDEALGDRRLWLVDEALEVSAPEGAVLGMRLFDAGPFHAGFGIIVAPDAETLDFCPGARERGAPLPFRHSLAATLYGDQLRADAPPGPADLALLQTLAEILTSEPTHRGRQSPKPRRASKPPRR